ncbi:MAG: hypothetical protein K2Q45_05385 [Nitrosomonas sp.]|nr:hypothetical protein [Nitrosomonas sp.]
MKVVELQVEDFIEAAIPKMQFQAGTGQFRLKMEIPPRDDEWKKLLEAKFSSQGYGVVFPGDRHVIISWNAK